MPTARCIKKYVLDLDENGRIIPNKDADKTAAQAADELDGLARAYQFDHPEFSYPEALNAVMKHPDHQPLVKSYLGVADIIDAGGSEIEPHDAARTIDERARERMKQTGEKNYVAAVSAVLAEDADLRRAYAQS